MKELIITNDTMETFKNCNPLDITKLTCLRVYVDKMNYILDNLYKFKNLKSIIISVTDITEMKGHEELVNLIDIHINNTKITEIKGLDNLVNLQLLDLYKNQITEIKGLENLVNLQHLTLNYNNITEIKGLDKLVNLHILYLDNNLITEIKELGNLVNLHYLYLGNNNITEIKEIDNLVNLRQLGLSNNNITEIKGLNNLVNLRQLGLSNNNITEIKGFDNLSKLEIIRIGRNNITEIKGFDKLHNLKEIELYKNQITEIKGLNHLINLNTLELHNNLIIELPLSLCNFKNLTRFSYYNNQIDDIHLLVHRWLDRNNIGNIQQNMIYNDCNNVQNCHIQNSFKKSLKNILKDTPTITLELVKKEIIESEILTETTKREILNYCDDPTEQSTYLITYADLLIYVWSRINNNAELLKILNQEISDGYDTCFMGRLTRLLNVLVGFYDDIEIYISENQQISNIILSLKNKFTENELRAAVKKELIVRQYDDAFIEKWLGYI